MPKAPQKCPKCFKPRTRNGFCEDHQPVNWRDKDRKDRAVYDNPVFRKQRPRILKRDPLCKLGFDGCTGKSTVVDHIVPYVIAQKAVVSDEELQGVCQSCHNKKTNAEAVAARAARREMRNLR